MRNRPKAAARGVTWKNCVVELDGKDLSGYFGSVHCKENSDAKRAWEGFELIMSTPEPFPDGWQDFVRSFPQDMPIRVVILPNQGLDSQTRFECDMYVHYRAFWWSTDRPVNVGRMIMRSLSSPRSFVLGS